MLEQEYKTTQAKQQDLKISNAKYGKTSEA